MQTRDQLRPYFLLFSYFVLMYDVTCSHVNVFVSFHVFRLQRLKRAFCVFFCFVFQVDLTLVKVELAVNTFWSQRSLLKRPSRSFPENKQKLGTAALCVYILLCLQKRRKYSHLIQVLIHCKNTAAMNMFSTLYIFLCVHLWRKLEV